MEDYQGITLPLGFTIEIYRHGFQIESAVAHADIKLTRESIATTVPIRLIECIDPPFFLLSVFRELRLETPDPLSASPGDIGINEIAYHYRFLILSVNTGRNSTIFATIPTLAT